MHREKFPEKVPFRLTRMLTNAMEVSGIEGNFRCTCERVMTVLRDNRDSLIAMLEAFVHDPLISWRLLGVGGGASGAGNAEDGSLQEQQEQEQPLQPQQQHDPAAATPAPQAHAHEQDQPPPTPPPPLQLQQLEGEGAHAGEGALVSPRVVQPPSQQEEEEEQPLPPQAAAGARVPSPAVTAGPLFGPDAQPPGARLRSATHDRFAALPTVSEAVGSGGVGEGDEEEEEEGEAENEGNGAGGKGQGGRKGKAESAVAAPGVTNARAAEPAAEAGDVADEEEEETPGTTSAGSTSAMLGAAGSLGAATSAATSAAARRARMADLHLEIGSLAASLSANKTRFSSSVAMPSRSLAQSRLDHRSVRERELVHALGPEGLEAPAEVLNEKAIAVIRRVQDKLTGLDFDNDEALEVADQVERLILQGTSKENLCQLFTGWCSFW